MSETTHDEPKEALGSLWHEPKYSNSELYEFASHLGSLECPHPDLAVAFAGYIGLNLEMICSAWEYRFYNTTAPHDERGKLLARFDEIVALIRRNIGT